MKTIRHFKTAKDKLLRIETEGCIVTIRIGLKEHGTDRGVTHIEILPDVCGDGCVNSPWMIADYPKASALNVRLVQND